ncbi:MAG: hypothetical protein FWD98_08575, partial [Defluviitaleaceae bacterium]|nr:hypothetical protein [Defluviitaleaceae bacterium]
MKTGRPMRLFSKLVIGIAALSVAALIVSFLIVNTFVRDIVHSNILESNRLDRVTQAQELDAWFGIGYHLVDNLAHTFRQVNRDQ